MKENKHIEKFKKILEEEIKTDKFQKEIEIKNSFNIRNKQFIDQALNNGDIKNPKINKAIHNAIKNRHYLLGKECFEYIRNGFDIADLKEMLNTYLQEDYKKLYFPEMQIRVAVFENSHKNIVEGFYPKLGAILNYLYDNKKIYLKDAKNILLSFIEHDISIIKEKYGNTENYIKTNFPKDKDKEPQKLIIKMAKSITLVHEYCQQTSQENSEDEKSFAELENCIKKLLGSFPIYKKIYFLMKKEEAKKEIKEQEEKAKPVQTAKPLIENTNKTHYTTDKEYKQIRKELSQYVNLRNYMPLRKMNNDEILHVISLLLKINIKKEYINLFLNNIYNLNNFNNPLAIYSNLYKKLVYYADQLAIRQNIETLNEIFKETFISSEEEYLEWKALFAEELYKILKLLPNNFDYEIGVAKKLMKTD